MIKALSVREPWAGLIRTGRKTIELRSWSVKYRGPLLICSGGRVYAGGAPILAHPDDVAAALARPRGVAVCIVQLVDVRPATARDAKAACSAPYSHRDFAWVLEDPREVSPVPIKGRLNLMTLEWNE